MSPLRRRLLLFFGSGLFCLLLCEVVLAFLIDEGRLFGIPLAPFGPTPHERQVVWAAEQRAELAAGRAVASGFDRDLGWTKFSGAGDSDGDSVDEHGARRVPREAPRVAGPETLRIATFGDSFTWCSEVEDHETWQVELERLEPRALVQNFGVGGYGTDQALLRFRRKRDELDADVVCIGMLLENIGRNVNRYRPLYYPLTASAVAKPRFVLAEGELELLEQPFETRVELLDAVQDGSVLERLAEHEFWRRRPLPGSPASSVVQLLETYLAYTSRDPRPLWTDPEGEPYRVSLEILRTFHREALAAGARRAPVLIFPRHEDLAQARANGEPYWCSLVAELEASGIPVLDLWEPLARSGLGTEELYAADGHLTARGNAIVAAALAEWLAAG